MSVAIPRIRDFRGLNPRSFDGRGNYSMGIREQIIFPEIDYDAIDQVRGLDVTITTTAATDEQAYHLLRELGMPFAREGAPGQAAEEPDEARRGAAQGGGAPARRGRAGGARAAQGGEPGGLREAGRARGGRRRRAAEAKRSRWPRLHRWCARSADRSTRPELQPLQAVRAPARLPAQVRPLPDLPARDRPRGNDPRPHEVELVDVADRSHRRLPHPHPQRPARRPRRRGDARLEASRPSWRASSPSRATSRTSRSSPARVGRTLRVRLKYTEDRKPVILGMQRVSKPGRRRYVAPDRSPRSRAAWAPRSSPPRAA